MNIEGESGNIFSPFKEGGADVGLNTGCRLSTGKVFEKAGGVQKEEFFDPFVLSLSKGER